MGEFAGRRRFCFAAKGPRDLRSNPKLVFPPRFVCYSPPSCPPACFSFLLQPLVAKTDERNPEDNGSCTLRDHHYHLPFVSLIFSHSSLPFRSTSLVGGIPIVKTRNGWFTRTRRIYVRRRDAEPFFFFSFSSGHPLSWRGSGTNAAVKLRAADQ